MTIKEIDSYTTQYPNIQLARREGGNGLVGQIKNTSIILLMEGDFLRQYQLCWMDSFMSRSYGLKTDLCTGERFVEVSLVGPSEFAGASIWLDDDRVGALSPQGTKIFDVPLGLHIIHVEGPNVDWSTQVVYSSTNAGYVQLLIE